jgi:hypothetical protein
VARNLGVRLNTLFLIALLSFPILARASAEDGTYSATVTTSSGTYYVLVEVNGGEVTSVHWPNGAHMTVMGGYLDGAEAYGANRRGEPVRVEIDDPNWDSDSSDEE